MRSGFPITRVEALGQAAVDERPRLPLEVETRAPGIRHGALALTLLAIGLGIYLRWVDLSSLFLIGDEEWNLQRARLSAGEILTGYDLMGSGIAVPFLQHLALQVFGEDLWALRIPGWLAGIAGLIATAAVGAQWVGRPAAALATFALATSSIHVYHTSFARCYTLQVLLLLVLVWALARAGWRPEAAWPYVALAAVAAGVLPYVHLMAAPFVAVFGVSLLLAAWLGGAARIQKLHLFAAFGVGAAICVLLFVPAWTELFSNVTSRLDNRPTDNHIELLESSTLLFGSRNVALAALVALPVASVYVLWARGSRAIPLVALAIVPGAAVVASRLAGPPAIARYILPALPFVFLLLAWMWVHGLRKVFRAPARADAWAMISGAVLVGLAWWSGPLGTDPQHDGPYANLPSHLSVYSPPKDRGYDDVPDFYRQLASEKGPISIIEAPAIRSWGLQLYRNYYLHHRKRTLLGVLTEKISKSELGPYVPILDSKRLRTSGASYLVLHRDLKEELGSRLRVWMPRGWAPYASPAVRKKLRRELGKPVYVDRDILVWRLAPVAT